MIIDSHAHLSDERLIGRVGEICDGLDKEGIAAVFEVGYDLDSSKSALTWLRDTTRYLPSLALIRTTPINMTRSARSFICRTPVIEKSLR